jgi:tRNA U34 5-methylaminomethyl-2-thiouridine-forming methyltransferase MnmC
MPSQAKERRPLGAPMTIARQDDTAIMHDVDAGFCDGFHKPAKKPEAITTTRSAQTSKRPDRGSGLCSFAGDHIAKRSR